MADAERRQDARLAHQDPEAQVRVKRGRCRSGECCAHATFPPVPDIIGIVTDRFVLEHAGQTAYGYVSLKGSDKDILKVMNFLRALGMAPSSVDHTKAGMISCDGCEQEVPDPDPDDVTALPPGWAWRDDTYEDENDSTLYCAGCRAVLSHPRQQASG